MLSVAPLTSYWSSGVWRLLKVVSRGIILCLYHEFWQRSSSSNALHSTKYSLDWYVYTENLSWTLHLKCKLGPPVSFAKKFRRNNKTLFCLLLLCIAAIANLKFEHCNAAYFRVYTCVSSSCKFGIFSKFRDFSHQFCTNRCKSDFSLCALWLYSNNCCVHHYSVKFSRYLCMWGSCELDFLLWVSFVNCRFFGEKWSQWEIFP